jgi:hypothetical protein
MSIIARRHRNGSISLTFDSTTELPIIPRSIPQVLADIYAALPEDARFCLQAGWYGYPEAKKYGAFDHLVASIRKHADSERIAA